MNINPSTGDFSVYAEKEVVEQLDPEEGDPILQISLAEAKMMDPKYDLGDIVHVPIKSKEFGRIATQNDLPLFCLVNSIYFPSFQSGRFFFAANIVIK